MWCGMLRPRLAARLVLSTECLTLSRFLSEQDRGLMLPDLIRITVNYERLWKYLFAVMMQ